MLKGFSTTHATSGLIAVLVGYTSSAAIIFQAAAQLGANDQQISSWMLAVGLGMGLSSIGLSLYYKMPILTAWSTPGAVLLATTPAGVTLQEATGAFMLSAAFITALGLSGWFAKVMHKIPDNLSAAVLAGILANFCINAVLATENQPELVISMLLIYLCAKRLIPRYAVILVAIFGIIISAILGLFNWQDTHLVLTAPQWVNPELSWSSIISIGLPLFIVTMTSQNLPGIAAAKASGFNLPVSSCLTWTGLTSLVLAPFGGYAFNLAAITAAICMNKEAGNLKQHRYYASISAGVLYLFTGLLGASIVSLFKAFPSELTLCIAGIALLSTLSHSLSRSLENPSDREASLLTFLVTASGLTLFDIGSAFWGLIAGTICCLVYKLKSFNINNKAV